MKKIIFCLAVLVAHGVVAQITMTRFSPDIVHDHFGSAIDTYGNEIVAYSHDDLGFTNNRGRVFIFEVNGSVVTQQTYFTPTDITTQDFFGSSLSIENGFIAAGSKLNDEIAVDAGAVYMYAKVNGNWQYSQKITASDSGQNDYFGSEVKLFGNHLFVSSPDNEATGQPATTNSGAVYVYGYDGTAWNFSQKLTLSGSRNFGSKIRVSGNKLVTSSNLGIHTYEYNGTNWDFSSTITFPSTANISSAVDFDLDNNQLFTLMYSYAGPMVTDVNVYDYVAGNWSLNTTIPSVHSDDKMGTNFRVKGDLMLICLDFHPLMYAARTPVTVYKKNQGTWSFQEIILGSGDTFQDDSFGKSMAISDQLVVIGAPLERPAGMSGKVYTFDLALGVDEISKNISIYPNPTTDAVYISDDIASTIKSIDIYQYDGKLIKSVSSQFESVSLSGFQNGIYMMKLTMDNGSSTTKKIVKI